MTFNLKDAHARVRAMMEQRGYGDQASCVQVIYWHHSIGEESCTVLVSAFKTAEDCQNFEANTFAEAIDRLRAWLEPVDTMEPGVEITVTV